MASAKRFAAAWPMHMVPHYLGALAIVWFFLATLAWIAIGSLPGRGFRIAALPVAFLPSRTGAFALPPLGLRGSTRLPLNFLPVSCCALFASVGISFAPHRSPLDRVR